MYHMSTFFKIVVASIWLTSVSACQEHEATEKTFFADKTRGFYEKLISDRGYYSVTLSTEDNTVLPINEFHNWVIEVKERNGSPVYPAKFSINGGMPAHGHGLPTQPMVTQHLGDGRYLLEGVKFNMSGEWQMRITVATQSKSDRAELTFNVDF